MYNRRKYEKNLKKEITELLSTKTSYFYNSMAHTISEKLISDSNGFYKFSLAVQEIIRKPFEKNVYWISSDFIPHFMLEDFQALISPKLIYETEDSLPDSNYLDELLTFVGHEIIKNKTFSSFFYPSFMVDSEGNVRTEIRREFNDAKIELQNGDLKVVTLSKPIHLHFFKQLISIPKKYIKKRYSVERITRTQFETTLDNFELASEYVEIYSKIARFKMMRNEQRVAEFFIALDIKNEPLLVVTVLEDV